MSYIPAITTISLGQPVHHGLETKLLAASRHGILAIELFFDDLEALAGAPPLEPHEDRVVALLDAARTTRHLCRSLGITVLNLQPFRFFEGLLDREETKRLLDRELPLWLDILHVLESDTLLVASNFLGPDPHTGSTRTSGDANLITSDLRDLASVAARASPPVRVAYEAIAWGNHVWLWEQAWDIVRAVNRPNMGLALDTFNIACAAYADPAMPGGFLCGRHDIALASLGASLDRLAKDVDLRRVFVVQIADGERLTEPLLPGHAFHVPSQPNRMSWSRNARLFPCEGDRGGYLPILDIVACFVDLGWKGPMPFEIFSRSLSDPDPQTVEDHAQRAARSWAAMTIALESTFDRGKSEKAALTFEKPHMEDFGRLEHVLEEGN